VGTPKAVNAEDTKHFPEKLPFPIIVKPSSSAGSKGSAIVNTKSDLLCAIRNAEKASVDNKAVTEEYIENGRLFLVVYFFHKGQAYVQQLSDAFFGNKEDGMERINVAYRSPFSLADNYMKLANDRVVAMLKSIGVDTGPVCLQGFMTDEDALFFDPGRRFPGGEYERIIKQHSGIDMMKGMVIFALTGEWPREALPVGERPYLIDGKTTIRIQINVGPGTVHEEICFDDA
jgi:carbamoylphosphate synthase large subunit